MNNPKNEIDFSETCNINEKFLRAKKRIAKKLNKNINNLLLMLNSFIIDDQLRICESGFLEGDLVVIKEINKSIKAINEENNLESDDDENLRKEKVNIKFLSPLGVINNIVAYKNIPIGIILLFYMLSHINSEQIMDNINGKESIHFLFNGAKLNINDSRKVGKLFKNIGIPIIKVSFSLF